jgi:transcriptional regulator with XRE-family HTH domain
VPTWDFLAHVHWGSPLADGKGDASVAEARRSPGSPTVRRRELGALLRALRNGRGVTVDQVAAQLLCSPSKVSRMETGQRGATLRDIRDLCDLYGLTDPAERERLMTLAREGKQQGWWQSWGLPYSTFVGLEQEAVSMRIFHSAVVPGLLQTAGYARALHQAYLPPLEPEIIEQRVTERLTRQGHVLDRSDPPRLEIVIDEAVLQRPVGGAAVISEQLAQLTAAAGREGLTLQILPFEAGAHPALLSDFIVLEFSGPAANTVYLESLAGQIYLDRPDDVQRYLQVFDQLRSVADEPKDSIERIAKIRSTYSP